MNQLESANQFHNPNGRVGHHFEFQNYVRSSVSRIIAVNPARRLRLEVIGTLGLMTDAAIERDSHVSVDLALERLPLISDQHFRLCIEQMGKSQESLKRRMGTLCGFIDVWGTSMIDISGHVLYRTLTDVL